MKLLLHRDSYGHLHEIKGSLDRRGSPWSVRATSSALLRKNKLTLVQVPQGWNIPVRSVIVCFVVTSLLSCINLGSSTALNAINSLGGVSILTSYFITISCLVWRRLYGPPLPPRRWSLGRYGLAINIASLLVLTPLWFFSFWPLAMPVTPENMNWSSAMFGGTLVFAMIWYYLKARHEYTGPVVQMKRYE